MRPVRPISAASPAGFGRRALACPAVPQASATAAIDDLRLFATSYAVGFLFLAVLIF